MVLQSLENRSEITAQKLCNCCAIAAQKMRKSFEWLRDPCAIAMAA
jgi:hypothetical protein